MAGKQDNEKLECIYLRYKDLMHHIANNVLRDYHLAEDAVSQAFFRISENLDLLPDEDSAQTRNFVSLVTKRAAIDMYRKQAKMNVVSLDSLVSEFSGAEPAVNSDEPEDLESVIKQLPPEYRKALLLKYDKGYGTKEIAAILNCSEAKAAKLVTRGKAKLRELIIQADK